MIVQFKFDYATRLTLEQAAKLQPLLRGNPELLVGEDAGQTRWWQTLTGDVTAILETLPELAPHLQLTGVELGPTALEYLMEQLRAMKDRLEVPVPKFNNHVQVVVPSLGMLLIDEVMVEEDCCTNRLQEQLDLGWRILAVCPQDARRPDYVLGRKKP